jgi:hypothetical protein
MWFDFAGASVVAGDVSTRLPRFTNEEGGVAAALDAECGAAEP